MTSQKSTKRDIILLISVPLGLAIILAAVVYIPQLLARPAQDFLYTTCVSYSCAQTFTVQNGVLVEHETSDDQRYRDTQADIRYYDVSQQSSRSLSRNEAAALKLDSSSRSRDGYTLTRESASSGLLFSRDSQTDWVLKNGLLTKQVELSTGYYNDTATFIGWVVK